MIRFYILISLLLLKVKQKFYIFVFKNARILPVVIFTLLYVTYTNAFCACNSSLLIAMTDLLLKIHETTDSVNNLNLTDVNISALREAILKLETNYSYVLNRHTFLLTHLENESVLGTCSKEEILRVSDSIREALAVYDKQIVTLKKIVSSLPIRIKNNV